MTNREKLRYRREMHQRIRAVVAERRLARYDGGTLDDGGDPTAGAGLDQRANRDEESLIGG